MKINKTNLKDCIIIEPEIHKDERGFFFESFRSDKFEEVTGIDYKFVQDNHSKSSFGVLRGLHFQIQNPQGKLVRVISGEVFDVAVDLRRDSSTYLESFSILLSSENKKQLWVPPGFAHGFLVTSKTADFVYKCTSYYDPSDEGSIIWNDSDLNIKWPVENPIVSPKDQNAKSIKDLKK